MILQDQFSSRVTRAFHPIHSPRVRRMSVHSDPPIQIAFSEITEATSPVSCGIWNEVP